MAKINPSATLTSKNYLMNDIEIEDTQLLCNIKRFDNYTISPQNTYVLDQNIDSTLARPISKILETMHPIANVKTNLTINKTTTHPILINAKFDKQNNSLVDILNITTAPNVDAQLIIKYEGTSPSFHNGVIKLKACKNSHLSLIVYSNFVGNNYLNIEDQKEQGSCIDYHLIDFSSAITIHNLFSNTLGTNTSTNLNTIYYADKNSILDLNYYGNLKDPKSNAAFFTVGALCDNATKHYKGTINFVKGAKASTGDENEYCILLSPTTKARALPILLCNEEDVNGSHSTSAGKVDESSLFYLQSRGIKRNDAIKMLIRAQFSKSIKRLFDNETQKLVSKNIDRRINVED